MRVIGTDVVNEYWRANASDQRTKAAQAQFRAWETITREASWDIPQDVQVSHPKASILKNSRVVFNIKSNDYRLVCVINYKLKLVVVRWFGSHVEYDAIDVNTI